MNNRYQALSIVMLVLAGSSGALAQDEAPPQTTPPPATQPALPNGRGSATQPALPDGRGSATQPALPDGRGSAPTTEGRAGVPPATAGPRLEIDPPLWDFGVVWEGEPVQRDVQLKNVGTAPLQIDKVKPGCGCTAAQPATNVLAPGESTPMSVSYNTNKRKGKANQIVTIQTNDPVQPTQQFHFVGDVKPLYRVEPEGGLAFGRLARESVETRTVTIVNEHNQPLLLKLKKVEEGPYQVDFRELEPGTKYELTATSKPPLPFGIAKADIELESNLTQLPVLRLSAHGYVQPRVSVSPPSVYVPKALVRPTERPVRLRFHTKDPLQIVKIESKPEGLLQWEVVAPTTQQAALPFASYQIRLKLPPGNQIPDGGAELIITTDAAEPEYARLVIPVTNERPVAPGDRPPTPSPPPGSEPGGSERPPTEDPERGAEMPALPPQP